MAATMLHSKEELSCNLPTVSVLIFTEGTILGPTRLIDWFNHKNYGPIKNCVDKINLWARQGAQVNYLTSRKKISDVMAIKKILLKNNFPGKYLWYRGEKEKYKDIAEQLMPQVLIEDDCWSIGGKWQMTITYVRRDVKVKIKSIIVKEFGGIDYLPENINDLLLK